MAEERYPYEIVSHWHAPGRIEDAYAVLTDGASLPRWWPQAYASVRQVAPGDAEGVGRIADIVTRGALPYDLKWRLEITEAKRPTMIRLKASGQLLGLGEWQLRQAGETVELAYTWRVRVDKPWMQRLEFLLKPLFALNHNWVMRKGEEGFKGEMRRRGGGAAGAESPRR
jgi:hypothetical protein